MADIFGDSDSDEDGIETRLESNGVMAFHAGTEEALFVYLAKMAPFEKVEDLLKSVDDYCFKRHWMMHIGPQKAKYLSEAIQRVKAFEDPICPLRFIELGSYCGYSSVLIASQLARRDAALIACGGGSVMLGSNKSKLISIEPNEACVQWTRRMAELAGLSDYITVLQTQVDSPDFSSMLQETMSKLPSSQGFDLVFIDHDKSRYLDDLVILENMTLSTLNGGASSVQESMQLLKSGCVVVADNVLSFNSPLDSYLNHVRNQTEDPSSSDGISHVGKYTESRLYKDTIEYSQLSSSNDKVEDNDVDGVEVSILR